MKPALPATLSHTPGPWHVAHSPTYGSPFVTNDSGKLCLTGTVGPKDLSEAEANARLIAAAPDLLALALRTQKAMGDLLAVMPAGMPPEMRAWKDAVRDLWAATVDPVHRAQGIGLTNAKNSENVALVNRAESGEKGGSAR